MMKHTGASNRGENLPPLGPKGQGMEQLQESSKIQCHRRESVPFYRETQPSTHGRSMGIDISTSLSVGPLISSLCFSLAKYNGKTADKGVPGDVVSRGQLLWHRAGCKSVFRGVYGNIQLADHELASRELGEAGLWHFQNIHWDTGYVQIIGEKVQP